MSGFDGSRIEPIFQILISFTKNIEYVFVDFSRRLEDFLLTIGMKLKVNFCFKMVITCVCEIKDKKINLV